MENHGSHSGIDLYLTYHFCPQVCNFPRCKVMKARRKKKGRAPQQEQIGFFNQVLRSACQRLCAAMFCALPWLNTIRGWDECEQCRNGCFAQNSAFHAAECSSLLGRNMPSCPFNLCFDCFTIDTPECAPGRLPF